MSEEEALVVSRDMMGRFSHRLRSMLTSVGAAADYVLTNEVEQNTQDEMLGIISEQADRIEGLLEDFLVVAADRCDHDSHDDVVNLYHVSREAVQTLAAEAQSAGAWLVLDACGGPSTVFGQRPLLRQAVIASVRAIIGRARPGDRVVARLNDVIAVDGTSTVELTVTVEPQNDGDGRATGIVNLTDLSLDAASRICEHHGGSFELMDRRPGVVCRLPAAPMPEGPVSVARQMAEPLDRPRRRASGGLE
jgi:signal transduction histidine kinase